MEIDRQLKALLLLEVPEELSELVGPPQSWRAGFPHPAPTELNWFQLPKETRQKLLVALLTWSHDSWLNECTLALRGDEPFDKMEYNSACITIDTMLAWLEQVADCTPINVLVLPEERIPSSRDYAPLHPTPAQNGC